MDPTRDLFYFLLFRSWTQPCLLVTFWACFCAEPLSEKLPFSSAVTLPKTPNQRGSPSQPNSSFPKSNTNADSSPKTILFQLTSAEASHRRLDPSSSLPELAAVLVKRERSERTARRSGAVAQTPALSRCLSPSLSWWLPVGQLMAAPQTPQNLWADHQQPPKGCQGWQCGLPSVILRRDDVESLNKDTRSFLSVTSVGCIHLVT